MTTPFRQELRQRAAAKKAALELAAERAEREADAHVKAWRACLLDEARKLVPKPPPALQPPIVAQDVVHKRPVPNPDRGGWHDDAVAARLEEMGLKVDDLPHIVKADVRLVSLIGGLARLERTESQTMAAARYRLLWERSQIGAARATDYTQAKVDVSGASQDHILDIGADARREYSRAVRELGMVKSQLVEEVVCRERTVRELARSLGEGRGGAAFERAKERLLEAIDMLVELYGYEGAPSRRKIRGAGDVAASDTGYTPVRRACMVA